MAKLYHICLTSHDEVLIRNEEDAKQMTNLSALSAYKTDTVILTDSEMSTHLHYNLMSENPKMYIFRFRDSFTSEFNYRHKRRGPLFDANPFCVQLEGPHRTQMALSYGLRQGMHHGITQTPFEYPWCTCNYLFARERGVLPEKAMFKTHSEIKTMFRKGTEFPDTWQANSSGILLRSTFEDIPLVETWYGTVRSYLTCMNKKTSEEWLNEQDADKVSCPKITLDLLESGFTSSEIKDMLYHECNPKYVQRNGTDMEICKLIDGSMVGRFGKTSIYELDISQKMELYKELYYDYKYRNPKQLARCLAIKYKY